MPLPLRACITSSALAIALIHAGPAIAQTWTGGGGTGSPFWTTAANWSGGIPASSTATAITFGPSGSLLSVQNVANPFLLNSLTFLLGDGPYNIVGSDLDFRINGVLLPQIVQNAAVPIQVSNNLTLTNNLTVAGTGIGGLTLSGAITGGGSLTQNAVGTLTLTNTANSYSGGTTVQSGTLVVGANGAVLPAGRDVIVTGGGVLNLGGFGHTSAAQAIDKLTLNNGTLRVPSGSANFYANRLDNSNGGGINVAGSTNFTLHLTGADPIAYVFSNTTWTGGGTSSLVNDTAAPAEIYVLDDIFGTGQFYTLTSNLRLANGAAGQGFRVTGGGVLALSPPPSGSHTAHLAVGPSFNSFTSYLSVSDLAAINSLASLTLDGGALIYGGPTATTSRSIILGQDGGQIYVGTAGATLALTGPISESAAGHPLELNFNTGSVVTLTGTSTYTGPTIVGRNGVLSVATLPNGGVNGPIGASSNAPSNLQLGDSFNSSTLRYTGSTATTDRGLLLGDDFSGGQGILEVTNVATNLTIGGQITGDELIKIGPGTLTLTNSSNNHTGGTFVNAGILAIGGTNRGIPNGTNVTVAAGATFQPLGTASNAGATVGTLTLNGGTFRIVSGSSDYYLNRLVMATGGTVDLTGASIRLQLIGTGAGVTVTGDSIWTGGTSSVLRNNSGGLVDISIAPSATLTSGLRIGDFASTLGFRITGGGTLAPTNTNSLAPLTITQGTLRVADVVTGGAGTLGGGALTLDGGTISYTGPTAATTKVFAMTTAGGTVAVNNPAASLTLNGEVAGGFGVLAKAGPGTLVLGNIDNALGGVAVYSGRLDVPSDFVLGTGSVTVGALGTVRYTATTATARTLIMNGGMLEAASGVTLTLNGATIGGGFLRGAGTYVLNGGTSVTGATTFNSATINQSGLATLINFTNGGSLTNAPGATLTWNGGTNTSSGRFTVNGTVNASDLSSNGIVNVNPGGTINHSGGDFVLGGGSVTNVGIYNPTNGQVTLGGTINLGSRDIIVQGGLLRNNGTITTSGKLIVDFGGVAKGSGDYDTGSTILRNGGILIAGNSPGLQRQSNPNFVGASTVAGDLNNATGVVGGFPAAINGNTNNSGWSAIEFGNPAGTASGLTLQRGAAGAVRWQFETTINDGIGDTPGNPANFSATSSFTWPIFRPRTNADAANPIPVLPSEQLNTVATITLLDVNGVTLPNTDVNLNQVLTFDSSLFRDPVTSLPISPSVGTFSFQFGADLIGRPGTTISVLYTPTPVPEPTLILLTIGVAAGGFVSWRRWLVG